MNDSSNRIEAPAAFASSPAISLAALVWLIGFTVVFFLLELPNNRPLHRYEIIPEIPHQLLRLMDVLDPPRDPDTLPSGISFLPQRLPAFGIALLMLFAAHGWGCTLNRVLPSQMNWTTVEGYYFRTVAGLGVMSLVTLGLGLIGLLSTSLFWLLTVLPIGLGVIFRGHDVSKNSLSPQNNPGTSRGNWLPWVVLACVAPFVVAMAFGAASWQTDFDVNEYHLGGPKEWFLAGQISFLPHNVYTSFPFLTEMLLLQGMVLSGDWNWGSLAGQTLLMLMALLTALGLWCSLRRWCDARSGWWGVLVFLTTPWIYRISIIAYAEGGLATMLFAAFAACLVVSDRTHQAEGTPWRSAVWVGFLAGSAMSCKYTGLVSAVIPLGLWLLVDQLSRCSRLTESAQRQPVSKVLLLIVAYVGGTGLAVGPWLLKNACETGNPVYPLGYRVFGGRDLDDELAEKWRRGHARPSKHSLVDEVRDFGFRIVDVAMINDWQSPLVFGLASLAIVVATSANRRLRYASILAGLAVGWQFLTWWLFTHHLDRFWVPLIPLAVWLAGVGATAITDHRLRIGMIGIAAACTLYNFVFCTSGLGGYNSGLTELNKAQDFTTRITGPDVASMNQMVANGTLPKNARVLCVGEAELFPAKFDYLYNTVFDHSLFETWLADASTGTSSGDRDLLPASQIQAVLKEHRVTHIYVNWQEILRYRQSYGYTDFVHPRRFAALQSMGILGPSMKFPIAGAGYQDAATMQPHDRKLIETWAPELLQTQGSQTVFVTGQLFPVLESGSNGVP